MHSRRLLSALLLFCLLILSAPLSLPTFARVARGGRAALPSPSTPPLLASCLLSCSLACSLLLPPPAAAASSRVIGNIAGSGIVFKDSLTVEAFEDPKIPQISLYISNFQKP
jgi:hypothetical protein